MAHPLEFYFDYSSPYGYFASTRIDELAAKYGREVLWRPMLLGAVFKITGGQPFPQVPLKGEYAARDFVRTAAFHGIPFNAPSAFPISGVAPSRAFYWAEHQDPERAIALAKALLRAYFVDDVNVSAPDEVVKVATGVGFKATEVAAGMNEQATKDITKAEVDKAIARGVFGSPYVIVDGEPFWGFDRMDQLERWLDKGPW